MSRLLAAIYDRFMQGSEDACLRDWRAELLADLSGDVLEIGAGTGASLVHYPPAVARLVLSEPDPHMRKRLAARAPAHVEVSAAPAHAIDQPDRSFDTVVCFLVLCSVDRPYDALAEVRRVLKPGGRFVFIEHVAADARPERLKWQRRIEPFWKRLAGNCHLTRRTEQAILDAGFELEHVKRESIRKANPLTRASVRGIARLSI
ncbi:MAG: class I SAM-dependent methyltransferase [Myxococcales bacterium]|nr:class I SAM-dependent methyltransferase [Myxococcales bacterium]